MANGTASGRSSGGVEAVASRRHRVGATDFECVLQPSQGPSGMAGVEALRLRIIEKCKPNLEAGSVSQQSMSTADSQAPPDRSSVGSTGAAHEGAYQFISR